MRRLLLMLASVAAAQTLPGPALSVDAGALRHAISPDVYGINFYWDLGEADDPNRLAYLAAAPDVRATVRRWGGSSTSEYSWQFDISNVDVYWFFEVLPDMSLDASRLPEGSYFNQFADQARATGGKIMGSVPILGWLVKARTPMCSYSVARYGPQCKVDSPASMPWGCGNGIAPDPACGDPTVNDGRSPQNPRYIQNDPTDVYAFHDESFQVEWIRYLLSRYGKGNQGGVAIWSLDNEPIWWDLDHRDIHPQPYTYDELLDLDMRYARAIKQTDPTALVAGPVGDNWASLWFSKADIVAGWQVGNYWSNPVDRNAHGGIPFLPWYLQQFRNYEQQHGTRLLDYLDQHAYLAPAGVAFQPAGDAARQARRLRSTRVFWDPNYLVVGDYWIRDVEVFGGSVAPQLIRRLRDMVTQNYPGTKIAITEYNWGALDDINGGLAQADLLGIFGREGVDLAALWAPGAVPKPALFSPPTPTGVRPTDPGAFAFKIYRNYDGMGGTFGETGVQAFTGNADQLSIFAAERSDRALTILVLNKTTSDLSSTVDIANFTPAGTAQVWRYSGANLNAIVRQPDAGVGGNAIQATFPAYSMTLFVVPAPEQGPKPVVTAVASAASHQSRIAAGQFVIVSGTGFGAGMRILFDGVTAPLVYVDERQCLAAVPYLAALKPTVHVQVEYQGVRSDPFEVSVSATAPGLFTLNGRGTGQAAALNSGALTLNSSAAPATPGSVVAFWGTGEGVTDPPGVDGRLAIDILPKPVAACAVEIGGLPAAVEYCGAAPNNMPGLFQINARIDPAVTPGDAVPVRVVLGGTPSQDGVTLAVR